MKQPLISYDREYDVLRRPSGAPSKGAWVISDALEVDYDERGKPAATIELLDAAKLLLPLLCPDQDAAREPD